MQLLGKQQSTREWQGAAKANQQLITLGESDSCSECAMFKAECTLDKAGWRPPVHVTGERRTLLAG